MLAVPGRVRHAGQRIRDHTTCHGKLSSISSQHNVPRDLKYSHKNNLLAEIFFFFLIALLQSMRCAGVYLVKDLPSLRPPDFLMQSLIFIIIQHTF